MTQIIHDIINIQEQALESYYRTPTNLSILNVPSEAVQPSINKTLNEQVLREERFKFVATQKQLEYWLNAHLQPRSPIFVNRLLRNDNNLYISSINDPNGDPLYLTDFADLDSVNDYDPLLSYPEGTTVKLIDEITSTFYVFGNRLRYFQSNQLTPANAIATSFWTEGKWLSAKNSPDEFDFDFVVFINGDQFDDDVPRYKGGYNGEVFYDLQKAVIELVDEVKMVGTKWFLEYYYL